MNAAVMLRMCCVCHRIERQGQWRSLALPAADAVITHGYCPECFVEAMAMIETVIARQGAGNSRNRQTAGVAGALLGAGAGTSAEQWQSCV